KIRDGFVSNSSSSSFIILIKKWSVMDNPDDKDFIATEEDIKKAKEYGFTETETINPFRYEELRSVNEAKPIERPEQLGLAYAVTCNEDDVIYFLVKNNIPFKASTHYQNHYYCYGRGWDYILRAENFGQTMCMYGEEYEKKMGGWLLEPVKKIPKQEFLEQEKKYLRLEENLNEG
ncbi:hypothetical protein LCGC14_1518450, partial [marine sediment metagenome]